VDLTDEDGRVTPLMRDGVYAGVFGTA
jgi:hypothetical protein